MSETRIEADVIYQHEKYGDVLVTGIAKMYSEWDVSSTNGLDGQPSSASENEVLVFFYDNYDGYGGMNPTPISQTAGEFAKASTRKRMHEYVDMSSLKADDDTE